MWSDGTQVTAQDVMFWLNMMLAVPQDWGLGTGFPQNVKDITVVSPTELTMVMDKPYNPTWFLYNELSQITPMPAAWDRTASGPSSNLKGALPQSSTVSINPENWYFVK
jgi:peptide/nickel transport system substrate-binding protein